MRIDVSVVPLGELMEAAREFPLASFSFSACAVAEQVVLEVV